MNGWALLQPNELQYVEQDPSVLDPLAEYMAQKRQDKRDINVLRQGLGGASPWENIVAQPQKQVPVQQPIKKTPMQKFPPKIPPVMDKVPLPNPAPMRGFASVSPEAASTPEPSWWKGIWGGIKKDPRTKEPEELRKKYQR